MNRRADNRSAGQGEKERGSADMNPEMMAEFYEDMCWLAAEERAELEGEG
jgi:hypothetical protein